MHAIEMLQEYFKKSLPKVHLKIQNRIFLTVESLLMRSSLTITSLGRHTKGTAFVKHKIKAVDRLTSNLRLLAERIEVYRVLANKLIGNLKYIDIMVDWSPAGNHENHILRASLALEGRCVVIYEEVHPEQLVNNYKVHEKFLKNLAKVLPQSTNPVIVTDAGFKTDWFLLVLEQGWDFEGRICSNMHYKIGDNNWQALTKLYPKATKIAKHVGSVLLTKANKLPCEMYLYRGVKTTGKNKSKTKKKYKGFAKDLERYKRQYKQPWVIVTSVITNTKPEKIITRYKRRMKIEHEFRNNKNNKWGLGLNETRTRDCIKLTILLLVAAIAMLAIYLIGLVAEQNLMHYKYQVNSIKDHRVISLIFLGLQIIEHDLNKIARTDVENAFKLIQQNEMGFYANN
jgi:hypothetical protein